MIKKIFSPRHDEALETDDTGTYADGMFPQQKIDIRMSARNDRSSYERDYGLNRKVVSLPVGYV